MQDGMQPLGLALVVCDWIHRDPGNGKLTILGTFSNVLSPEYPFKLHAMAVYAAITECRVPFKLTLQIVDVNEDRDPIVKVENSCDLADPLGVVELDFRLVGVDFPEPGEYRVQLLADDTLIMDRRIIAIRPDFGDTADEQ